MLNSCALGPGFSGSGIVEGASQDAVEPPPEPAQLHDQGPEALTAEAVPALHSAVVGALATATPSAAPQAPLVASEAEHKAMAPPLLPAQLHDHVPKSVTAEAAPELHRLVVGALLNSAPLAAPHAPLSANCDAAHEAVVPPLLPLQLQVHVPPPATEDAVPALHNPELGAVLAATPFAAPQAPFANSSAEQEVEAPPPELAQLHDQGPDPPTAEAVPELHKLAVGALLNSAPLAAPHAALAVAVAAVTAKLIARPVCQFQLWSKTPARSS